MGTEEASLPTKLLRYNFVQRAQGRQRASCDGQTHFYLRPDSNGHSGVEELGVPEGLDISQADNNC